MEEERGREIRERKRAGAEKKNEILNKHTCRVLCVLWSEVGNKGRVARMGVTSAVSGSIGSKSTGRSSIINTINTSNIIIICISLCISVTSMSVCRASEAQSSHAAQKGKCKIRVCSEVCECCECVWWSCK